MSGPDRTVARFHLRNHAAATSHDQSRTTFERDRGKVAQSRAAQRGAGNSAIPTMNRANPSYAELRAQQQRDGANAAASAQTAKAHADRMSFVRRICESMAQNVAPEIRARLAEGPLDIGLLASLAGRSTDENTPRGSQMRFNRNVRQALFGVLVGDGTYATPQERIRTVVSAVLSLLSLAEHLPKQAAISPLLASEVVSDVARAKAMVADLVAQGVLQPSEARDKHFANAQRCAEKAAHRAIDRVLREAHGFYDRGGGGGVPAWCWPQLDNEVVKARMTPDQLEHYGALLARATADHYATHDMAIGGRVIDAVKHGDGELATRILTEELAPADRVRLTLASGHLSRSQRAGVEAAFDHHDALRRQLGYAVFLVGWQPEPGSRPS